VPEPSLIRKTHEAPQWQVDMRERLTKAINADEKEEAERFRQAIRDRETDPNVEAQFEAEVWLEGRGPKAQRERARIEALRAAYRDRL